MIIVTIVLAKFEDGDDRASIPKSAPLSFYQAISFINTKKRCLLMLFQAGSVQQFLSIEEIRSDSLLLSEFFP